MLATLANCAPRKYSAAPLSGQVVDKTTKEPITNAYVVAIYGLHGGHNGNYVAPLHYEETRSDEKGFFHFNGFTDIPIDYSRAPKNAFVLNQDPLLFFFAEGYLPWDAYSNIPSHPPGSFLQSTLDGIVVELEPMSGDTQENARKSRPFISGLYEYISLGYHNGRYLNDQCAITKLPSTLGYLRNVENEFKDTAVYTHQIPLRIYEECDFQGEWTWSV